MAAEKEIDPRLKKFRALPRPVRVVYARPRTFVALAIGFVTFLLLPGSLRLVTQLVWSWDVFIGFYLVFVYGMMLRGGHRNIRHYAALQDDGRFLILIVTALGAFASIAAIVSELGIKDRGVTALPAAFVTIALSWAAVHTTFALHYAHDYYRDDGSPGGLAFPSRDDEKPEEPDYWDFVYFSFVIGMTAQTADVGIADRVIRRTVIVHGLVAFIFNTALVALMVNIAASAI